MANSSVFACFLMLVAYSAAEMFTAEDGTLSCGTNGMTIDLNVASFEKHGREFTFGFTDADGAECSVASTDAVNGSLALTSEFNGCGIAVSSGNGTITYSQSLTITYGQNPNSSLIYREEKALTYEVECVTKSTVEVALDGTHVNVSSLEEQTVSQSEAADFDIKLYRTTDGTFSSPDTSSQMKLGDTMYFKLEMNTISDDLKVVPQTCYATNAKDSALKYYLIEDGCPNKADGTVKVSMNDDLQVFEWENKAFKFFGDSDAVFVSCEVQVCANSDDSASCERCSYMQRRKRRAAVATSASAYNARVYSSVYRMV